MSERWGTAVEGTELTAHAAHGFSMVEETLMFLSVAVTCILLLHRLRISPVLGYLAGGLILGPSGFAMVTLEEDVRAVAELGVVFLLFLIGLELSGERLRALRRWVFGLGVAQFLVTGALLAAVGVALGVQVPVAVLLGGGLALSSTAVVVQLLIERGQVASPTGRVTFAVLLLQDLAVVPLLLLATTLSGPPGQSVPLALAVALGKAVLAVVAILLLGRFTLGPLLRAVAATRSTELFTATALMIVLGTGWATGLGGLSTALGAFLAGLVLAGTEFRHQAESDMQPFKGLLLGLFFLSVGLGIDVAAIADRAHWILLGVVGLITLKALVAGLLARAFGAARDVAIRSGLLLGEAGEFAFVILATAVSGKLIDNALGQALAATVGLSIAVTPFLPALADRLVARFAPLAPPSAPGTRGGEEPHNHVIICGFGRVGQTVAALMARQQVPFVGIDMNADLVRQHATGGAHIHYGDSSRHETLKLLGADHAVAAIITLDDPHAAARTVAAFRDHWPALRLFARARDRAHAATLLAQGAEAVVPETFESSLVLARGALESLGVPSAAVDELVTLYRETDHGMTRPTDGQT
ncbi:monovalent cation:proton antiporter-2 (CPA2) family protein [Niveispirillum sp. KHB5.9]|uniref:monovalent cation:proton antiporter-2 (CPA2) family protein n=1 Tax=Niveispirillum sp. KHB5.9 TaxID=3400269 RepID=UPI003A83BAB8